MINAQVILRLALVLPPIRGFFLLGGGSYFISPMVSLFFLAITRNSAPKVSPPLRLNSETVSFLNALKLEKVSVTPSSLPNVLEAIISEILGSLVREAMAVSYLVVCWIRVGKRVSHLCRLLILGRKTFRLAVRYRCFAFLEVCQYM